MGAVGAWVGFVIGALVGLRVGVVGARVGAVGARVGVFVGRVGLRVGLVGACVGTVGDTVGTVGALCRILYVLGGVYVMLVTAWHYHAGSARAHAHLI